LVRRVVLWVAVIVLLSLAVVAGWVAAVWWPEQLEPVDPGGEGRVRVEIPRGVTTKGVARLLSDQGLIRNELVFRVYTRLEKLDGKIQAGEYHFSASETVPELLERLVAGDVIKYQFTVPEGYRVEQIAELLVAEGFAEEARLREALSDVSLVADYYEGGDTVREPLEGFLFPDTYTITRDTTEREIVELLVRRFESTFSEKWRERATELGMSIYDVVTLASIIEKEARVPEERAIISGVYHNRLEREWLLQSCPTVQYGLEDYEPPVLNEDLEVDTPYNTYMHPGLPPGPIANPGAEALRAALYPDDVPYLYFNACSADGKHAFATTLAEHNRNIRRCKTKTD